MLSERARRVRPSGIRRIFELAATLDDPIDLSIGQPDFGVPEPVREAAIRAIREGHSRYTVTEGLPELNEAIRRRVRERHGFDPGASLITAGVSGGLLLSYLALLDPGDEILVPDPHFVMYRVLAELTGAEARLYDTHPDFRIRREALERALGPRTKALLVNSPSNPTGHVLDEEEIDTVASFAREHDLVVISDEIYDAFVYDGPHRSVASRYPRTVLLGGFSKSLGMPGWRIGYAVGPPEILDAMKTFQQFTFVCANTVAQHAVLAALELDLTGFVDAYRRKRDLVVDRLKGVYDLVEPGGSFYAYPRLPEGTDGESFVGACLERKVLVVPGRAFSPRDSHFRISFATSDERLERGLEQLVRIAGG